MKRIVLSVCAAVAAAVVAQGVEDSESCGSAKIVFAGYGGTSELTNFPALVRISTEKMPGIDMSKFRQNGSDIRFFDADGIEIPHEVESWNPDGESLVWVRVPRLSGTTTFVTMKWGATSSPRTTAKEVWSAYAGVWHMNETATELPSATGNGLALSGAQAPAAVSGAVGPAAQFTKAFSSPSFLQAPSFVPESGYAVSTWYYHPVTKTPDYFSPLSFGAWQVGGWFVEYKNSLTGATLYRNTSSTPLGFTANFSTGWVHVTLVFDNGKLTAYQNGVRTVDAVNAPVTHVLDRPFALAAAQYDETRVMSFCPSYDWALADYATQKTPDFAVAEQVTNPTKVLKANGWVVRPSIEKTAVLPTQVPKVKGESLYGTLSLTYDGAFATTMPTENGWHVVHVSVEPTDEAYGLDAVDIPFYIRYSWSEENVGEATIDIPACPKSMTLTGYPLMLRLSTNVLAGVDMTTIADGGANLRFYDVEGRELAHDVEKLDRNGISLIWVRLPIFGPAAQRILMNWGDVKERTTTDADVWADYGAVWHMTTASNVVDASGHGLDLKGTTIHTLSRMASPRGAGVSLQSTMTAGDFYSAGVPRDGHTISFWYYYPDYVSGEHQIFRKGQYETEGSYLCQNNKNQLWLISNKNLNSGKFDPGVDATANWLFVTLVHTSGRTVIYVNGVSRYNASTPNTATSTYDFSLIRPVNFDEVRVRKSAMSADEAWLEYQNQQDALNVKMALVQNATADKKLVPIPPVPTETTYNGLEQRPFIPASDDYVVDYGAGDYTSVGDYTITLTLTDPENTEWAGQTTAPKVLHYRILWSDNRWTTSPSIDKPLWKAGEAAGTVVGAPLVGTMNVRYDEARVAEMPLTPGFHVAYCSVDATADHAGLPEVALCYRVLPAHDTGNGDMTIRLSGYEGKTTLTNFPVLVRLSAARVAGLDMSTFDAVAPKLRFYDEEGTRLNYDIERWDPAGESLVWVLVPRVKANTTRLLLQWRTSRETRMTRSAAWGDFAAVWHMDGSGTDPADVSGNGLNFETSSPCTQVAGPVGEAKECTARLTAADFFAEPFCVPKTDFSISCWYRLPNFGSDEMNVWQKGAWASDCLYLSQHDTSHAVMVADAKFSNFAAANARTTWNYVTVLYRDGVLHFSANGNDPSEMKINPLALGTYQFLLFAGAQYDEFRIRRSAPSADWVKADYATQSSGLFCTYSLVRNAKRSGLAVMIK